MELTGTDLVSFLEGEGLVPVGDGTGLTPVGGRVGLVETAGWFKLEIGVVVIAATEAWLIASIVEGSMVLVTVLLHPAIRKIVIITRQAIKYFISFSPFYNYTPNNFFKNPADIFYMGYVSR
jgi:hypothetical protein